MGQRVVQQQPRAVTVCGPLDLVLTSLFPRRVLVRLTADSRAEAEAGHFDRVRRRANGVTPR